MCAETNNENVDYLIVSGTRCTGTIVVWSVEPTSLRSLHIDALTSTPSGLWAKLFVIHNIVALFVIHKVIHSVIHNGLFPPTETDPWPESFPDCYIELCGTFSTGTETEMDTETFPDGYCTHFRDRSLSQFYYILIRGLESISVPVEKPA